MSSTTITKKAKLNVCMGQIHVAHSGETLNSILGSCIGLILYQPRLKLGAMAHIVLPDSGSRDSMPGKYSNTAIPHMIELLANEGAAKSGLVAKLAGGANMFGKKGSSLIGDSNAETVLRIRKELCIHVKGKHVGGEKGRRVVWDPANGDLTVYIAGKDLEVI